MPRKHWLGLVATLGVLFALSATAWLLPVPALVREVYGTALDGGLLGPLLFAAAVAVSVVVPPLPTRPLTISAGLLFDPLWGLLLVLAAQAIGASANFWIARWLGERWLRGKPEYQAYLKEVELLGTWQSIVLLRLFAGFTFDWYSYFAGLLRIRYRTYLLATVAGAAPRLAADVYAGNFLVSRPWLTALIGAAVTILSLALLARHSKMRHLARSWNRRPRSQ
ncbi:MAG TPA: VTT domain-containing protein [Patescibacteria group bacterium]|jgi:uncharacterized membrane protein YdjX (TVP38/TMEM64 family)